MRTLRILSSLALLLPVLASAARFPDVPDGHMYQAAIEALAEAGVIGGNPDGSFKPANAVNRAAMLKMLYRAAGLTPDKGRAVCFKDVEKGSWYEPYVCDAVERHIVQGFNDGTFRPSAEVTRTQAVKMMLLTFGFPVSELTDQTKNFLKFIDVATSAWYTKFLNAAFELHILPIDGQAGSSFYPERPLLRGEAAAYIYNAMKVGKVVPKGISSSSAVGLNGSSASSRKATTEPPPAIVFDVKFPWSENRTFDGKKPASFRFSLDAPATIAVTATLKEAPSGDLTCRLYRLTSEGFSLEYYLGINDGNNCLLLVALTPGTFQLQLQSGQEGAAYTVDVKAGKGDGNDGFSQAIRMQRGITRTEFLEAGDLQDWFTFTVNEERDQPIMTVGVVSTTPMHCTIYPMEDVDLFGFTGPECGTSYQYPPGTYIVGIGHGLPLGTRQTYTIQLK